jgi:hypothetical protein
MGGGGQQAKRDVKNRHVGARNTEIVCKKTGKRVKKRQAWVQRKTGKWVKEVQTRGSKKTEGVIKRNARGSKETSEKVEEGRQK